MKYPEGALKTILELKQAAVPEAVFYIVFDREPRNKTFKFLIPKGFKIKGDHVNRRWIFDVDVLDLDTNYKHREHTFWSPYGDLHFPTKNKPGFLFTNYWHAYAYRLKLERAA